MKKTHITTSKTWTNSTHLLKFGTYGFKLTENLWLTKNQFKTLDRLLHLKIKTLEGSIKSCKVWSLITFNKTLTKLPLESRMGKGKGSVITEIVWLKKGSVIYEFENIKFHQVKETFLFFTKYLSTKLILISKK